MLPAVLQDVNERMTDLPRCREGAGMVPIAPHLSVAAKGAIDCLRHANGEALDAATQSRVSVRFDEDVDMIALHAELQKPEARVRCLGERLSYRRENCVVPQRRQTRACSQGDVDGGTTVVHGPPAMGHAMPSGRGLSSGAVPPPTPGS